MREPHQDRPNFLTIAALAAFAFPAVSGCAEEKKPPTPSEIVQQLTNADREKAAALLHMQLNDSIATNAPADSLLSKILVAYGAILVTEMAEGTYRPTDNIVALLVAKDLKFATTEVLALTSQNLAQKLRDLRNAILEMERSRGIRAKLSGDGRELGKLADAAGDLALKLDTHPTFSFKTDLSRSLGAKFAGAPTAGDFQDMTRLLESVVRKELAAR